MSSVRPLLASLAPAMEQLFVGRTPDRPRVQGRDLIARPIPFRLQGLARLKEEGVGVTLKEQ